MRTPVRQKRTRASVRLRIQMSPFCISPSTSTTVNGLVYVGFDQLLYFICIHESLTKHILSLKSFPIWLVVTGYLPTLEVKNWAHSPSLVLTLHRPAHFSLPAF